MSSYKSINPHTGGVKNTILFISSPFIYLPFIFLNLKPQNRYNIIFLALLFGFISYLYIPGITNDKAKYLQMYQHFLNYDFDDFLSYLKRTFRPDFILHLILFAFAKMQWNSNIFFLLITSYTVYTWLYIFMEKAPDITDSFTTLILFVIFSLSLPDLFSGVKFYFASATLIWSYQFFDKKKYILGSLLIIAAVFTHFSLMIFGLIIIVNTIFPKGNSYKWLFYFSLFFLFTSKASLINIVSYINPIDVYQTKTQIYLNGEDSVVKRFQQGAESSIYNVVFSSLWIYVAYIYLILSHKNSGKFRNLVLMMMCYVNLMFCVPTVFIRYIIIIKFLFAILFIKEQGLKLRRSLTGLFLALYFIGFCFNIIILRHNLDKSLFNKENLLITTLISSRQ